jgi:energy-coupling factor transporter ATP-binding protein EcfA2
MKIKSVSALRYVGMTATLPLADGVATTLTGINASGKSMLASIVPGILFNELTLNKDAAVGLDFETAVGPGSMLVSKQGAKTVWRGTINGEAANHNTIRAAQGWMRENFPVTPSVFPTANYLAAFRSGTMLGGKPAERMALLSDIVGLQVFDELRKGVSKLAQSANVTLAMRERIRADMDELAASSLSSERVINLGGLTNYLSERRSEIRAEAMKLSEALDDRPYGNVPTDKLEAALALAPERNKAWDAWDEFKEAGGAPKTQYSEADYNAALSARDIVGMELLPLLTGKLKEVPKLSLQQKRLAAHEAEIGAVREQLAHLKGHQGNTCPTCSSVINGKKLVRGLTKALKSLESGKPALVKKVRLAEATEKFRSKLDRWRTTPEAVKARLDDFDEVIETYETSLAVQAKWGGNYPFKPDKPRIDTDEIKTELRLRKRGYGLLIDDEKRFKLLHKRYKGATGVLSAVNNIVEEQSEVLANRRRLQKLQAELAQLPNSEDAELLVELLKALDNRNARNKYLELVAEHWIATLNELAPTFFDYKMEFAWKSNGQLIANRKGGATDTVLLSGREGRTFLLLNAVAIQRCLPPGKRLRTLFLDEIEAGSDPSNRALLAEIIPTLLDHYDNIAVITPLAKSEFYVEGPRYRVTKDKTLVREE